MCRRKAVVQTSPASLLETRTNGIQFQDSGVVLITSSDARPPSTPIPKTLQCHAKQTRSKPEACRQTMDRRQGAGKGGQKSARWAEGRLFNFACLIDENQPQRQAEATGTVLVELLQLLPGEHGALLGARMQTRQQLRSEESVIQPLSWASVGQETLTLSTPLLVCMLVANPEPIAKSVDTVLLVLCFQPTTQTSRSLRQNSRKLS